MDRNGPGCTPLRHLHFPCLRQEHLRAPAQHGAQRGAAPPAARGHLPEPAGGAAHGTRGRRRLRRGRGPGAAPPPQGDDGEPLRGPRHLRQAGPHRGDGARNAGVPAGPRGARGARDAGHVRRGLQRQHGAGPLHAQRLAPRLQVHDARRQDRRHAGGGYRPAPERRSGWAQPRGPRPADQRPHDPQLPAQLPAPPGRQRGRDQGHVQCQDRGAGGGHPGEGGRHGRQGQRVRRRCVGVRLA
mmetsp:Transcript_23429/g.65587  ORF Transcript_23429/g.65587 Transcript_23429/m.65587 type:complete len:242 (-) Transcript_23429:749-1474(-)